MFAFDEFAKFSTRVLLSRRIQAHSGPDDFHANEGPLVYRGAHGPSELRSQSSLRKKKCIHEHESSW